jgi:hypothetical protein
VATILPASLYLMKKETVTVTNVINLAAKTRKIPNFAQGGSQLCSRRVRNPLVMDRLRAAYGTFLYDEKTTGRY